MAREKPAFDLYALDPAAKRAIEAEDRFKADLRTQNKFRARPQTGATISAPRRGGIERTADRLAAFGVPLSVTEAIKDVDRNLLGFDETAQSIRNIQSGDAGAGDYLNVALSAPVLGGAIVRPLEVAASKLGRGAVNLGRRALGTRAGRYLTEARPLLDNADDAIETAFTVTPGAQRRITNQRPVVQGLPAPEQRLGLPAPGPGLPSFAIKPRGGQWYVNDEITGANFSPENAALNTLPGGIRFAAEGTPEGALRDWWLKAAPRYIKNDLGTPDDPLRGLAEQGLLHADMSPDDWSAIVQGNILNDPISSVLLSPNRKGGMPGAGDDLRGEVLAKMPWLAKAPVTDEVYGVTETSLRNLEFPHLIDEMRNALTPEVSGLPADLAVRPESLARMGLPQAAERVARINQFRAKQAEQYALNAMDSPVVHTFKEYAEDNPRGLRWVEMAPPKGDGPSNYDVAEELQRALKYEGDTMGHCVGGYCPDVLEGRSRIFSLRDAKGEPHVTIETGRRDVPRFNWDGLRHRLDEDAQDAAYDAAMTALRERGDDALFDYEGNLTPFGQSQLNHEQDIFAAKWLMNNGPEGIIQIKGKQNRAPKDDYLPFVQDFVKSGQWVDVGDLANTGLVRLPDGRYLTHDQMDEIIRGAGLDDLYQSYDFNANGFPRDPAYMDPEDWAKFQHHFQGYARGGRALAVKPCSCDHSFSVR